MRKAMFCATQSNAWEILMLCDAVIRDVNGCAVQCNAYAMHMQCICNAMQCNAMARYTTYATQWHAMQLFTGDHSNQDLRST